MRITALQYNQTNNYCMHPSSSKQKTNNTAFKGIISICVPKGFTKRPEYLGIVGDRAISFTRKIRTKDKRIAISVKFNDYELEDNVVNSITFDTQFDEEGRATAEELKQKYSELKGVIIKFIEQPQPKEIFTTFDRNSIN